MRPARIRARGRRAGLVAAVEARTSSCRSSTTGAPDGRCVGSRSSTPSPSRSVTAGRALKPTDRTPETPFALQARPGQATHRAGAAAPRQGAVGPDTGRAAGPTTWRWRRESIWTARCADGPSRLCGAPTAEAFPPGSDPAPAGSSVSLPGPPVRVVAAQTIAEETGGNRVANNGPGGQDAEKGKGKANNSKGADSNGKSKNKGQRQEQGQRQGQKQGLTSAAARSGADRRRDTVLGTHRARTGTRDRPGVTAVIISRFSARPEDAFDQQRRVAAGRSVQVSDATCSSIWCIRSIAPGPNRIVGTPSARAAAPTRR